MQNASVFFSSPEWLAFKMMKRRKQQAVKRLSAIECECDQPLDIRCSTRLDVFDASRVFQQFTRSLIHAYLDNVARQYKEKGKEG